MHDDTLTVRERKVLEAVVRNYILSAEPTGSRFLSKHLGLGLSAATLRNVMGDLEDKGFITQPHTSAGRIPTDKGYRQYVDHMMEECALPGLVQMKIHSAIASCEAADLRVLLEATTRALSEATDQLGIVLAPQFARGEFRHIHIFEIESHRYLLHMTIDLGFVRTFSVELASEIPPERLSRACEVLNERFYGLSLADIVEKQDEVLRDVADATLGVIRLFIPSIRRMLLQRGEEDDVYTQGQTNIVLKPEFHAPEQLGAVVEMLGDRRMLMHLFDTMDSEPGRVVVSIGGENRNGMFESFSVVKARYKIGGLEGSMGVLGPKRMPYPLLVAAVDYTARVLGEVGRT